MANHSDQPNCDKPQALTKQEERAFTLDETLGHIYELYPALREDFYKPGEMESLPEDWRNLPERFATHLERLKAGVDYIGKGYQDRTAEIPEQAEGPKAWEDRTVKTLAAERGLKEEYNDLRRSMLDEMSFTLENAFSAQLAIKDKRQGRPVSIYAGGGRHGSLRCCKNVLDSMMREAGVPVPDLSR